MIILMEILIYIINNFDANFNLHNKRIKIVFIYHN